MFRALFSRLTGSAPPDPELDAQFAIAALLVRVAKADSYYAYEEIAEIDRIIAETWGLDPVAAMKLRAQAERIEADAPETAELAGLVQAHTPYEQRVALYEALWDVSLADRKLHADERRFLAGISTALGIAPEDQDPPTARHEAAAARAVKNEAPE